MLALEVTFLLGRYTATDYRDRERGEWPPHPARLFSAMVAATFEARLAESARAALLWLESLPPPQLYADESPAVPPPVMSYVPVNDPDEDLLPQRAERQPRVFPSVIPGVRDWTDLPAVWFVWPEANPDPTLQGLLSSIANHVTYLGSSRSPVRIRVADKCPEPNWVPDEQGPTLLRVASKGRLNRLEWHYQNGQRPPQSAFQRYRSGPAPVPDSVPQSAFGEMVVFRLQGPVEMEIETTLKLTHALRAAVLSLAQKTGQIPAVLSGHDEQGRPLARTHAAYVSLPFVSDTQRHADGRVMGLGVVFPRGIPSEERKVAIQALVALDHLNVRGVGRFHLQRLTAADNAPHNLQAETWAGRRRRWASVTPVLLDQFPKRGRTAESIVARSCEHIGLPRPADVTINRYSPLHGVEPSFRYLVRRSEPTEEGGTARAICRIHTHVELTFAEDVQGPVLIGAGRYFGLGLLRPLQEEPQ